MPQFDLSTAIAAWERLTRPRASDLEPTRLALHWSAQIAAAFGATFVAPKPDFSHTNLGWSAAHQALLSRAVETAEGPLSVGLRFADAALIVVQGDAAIAEWPIVGETFTGLEAKVFARVSQALGDAGGSAEALARFDHPLPEHAVDPNGAGEAFAPMPEFARVELARWYANADRALRVIAEQESRAGEVRCWPHHFDIATLIELRGEGEEAQTVGVGMTPGDGNYADAYWYVSMWPYPPTEDTLPELEGGGLWHREGWTGAVLTSTALREPQGENFAAFMTSAFSACYALLDGDAAGSDPAPSSGGGPIRSDALTWHKVADTAELPEGRVKAVSCGTKTVCLTHFEGRYGALDNACPHQGGPLGEGSIEKGWLRCPWHGWDYHPLTGKSPGSFDDGVDAFPVDIRDDGVYVGLEAEDDHVPTVSDRMVETMVNWGVRWVFGMVGHSNLGLADAVRRVTEVDPASLRYVGIRHEGAASFAVSAYGKLTGRPAAALAIAGPGATNLLTGLWDANVDRAPALALTGQVQSQVLGRGAFQELPLAKAFGEVATFGHTVLHESNHVELMNLACKHAILDRGVSHLIFPDEVQTIEVGPEVSAGSPAGRVPLLGITPDERSLLAAAQHLHKAERPVFIVGYGARDDMAAIIALAESLGAPVLTTFKAKGLIPDDHPLGCGVLGRSGTPIASWFMNESDLLVVFGSSFAKHTGITPKRPIVQVDWDRQALGRFHPVTVPVWGAIGPTVASLQRRSSGGGAGAKIDARPQVAHRWKLWRDEKASRRGDDRGQGINSALIFDALSRLAPADAIIAVDVGNNTYSFGRYFECKGQRVLMSGYLGSIGFGLPAAMGAWAATQEAGSPFAGRKVICVSGDGGFGQYMGELTTLVKYGMAITHVLVDNGELGKISKEQRSGQWHVWETQLHNPNFAEFARICGAEGIGVSKVEELDAGLERGLNHAGPALVHIRADALLT